MWSADSTLQKPRPPRRSDVSAATANRWHAIRPGGGDPFGAARFSTAVAWRIFLEAGWTAWQPLPLAEKASRNLDLLQFVWAELTSDFVGVFEAFAESLFEHRLLGPAPPDTMASRSRLSRLTEGPHGEVVHFPGPPPRDVFPFSSVIRAIEGLRERAPLRTKEAVERLNNAVPDALKFVAKLPDTVPAPTVSAAEDGEVVLEWVLGPSQAVAGFEGDGGFGYALLKNGKFAPGEHEGELDDRPLPADLISYLQAQSAGS